MYRNPLLVRVGVIALLMLLLSVPLMMVRDVISERALRRQSATEEVSRAQAGEQTLTGPVLIVPYTETFTRTVVVDVDKDLKRQETVVEQRMQTVFPSVQDTRSRLVTETRWRGIFPVTVYTSRHETAGRLVWPDIQPEEAGGQIALGQPYVVFGVSDLRGLQGKPELQVANQSLVVEASPTAQHLPLPLAAALKGEAPAAGTALDFTLGLDLAGTGQIGYVPLADDNKVSLNSSWPHPSFGGDFLPRTRAISDEGFEATWNVPALSTQARQQFLRGGDSRRTMERFVVALEDPVDAYRLTERATKYGMMFIVLTFATFFVLEMVKRWRIHPMQYLLIGAALVLFFLLLLSLSEHVDFLLAYGVASTACIALLTYYLRHVLGGWGAGLGMGGMLVALYGVLYGILISEDNSLMMGSLLLFAVLAAAMIATRKLDWYRITGSGEPPVQAPRTTAATAVVNGSAGAQA